MGSSESSKGLLVVGCNWLSPVVELSVGRCRNGSEYALAVQQFKGMDLQKHAWGSACRCLTTSVLVLWEAHLGAWNTSCTQSQSLAILTASHTLPQTPLAWERNALVVGRSGSGGTMLAVAITKCRSRHVKSTM